MDKEKQKYNIGGAKFPLSLRVILFGICGAIYLFLIFNIIIPFFVFGNAYSPLSAVIFLFVNCVLITALFTTLFFLSRKISSFLQKVYNKLHTITNENDKGHMDIHSMRFKDLDSILSSVDMLSEKAQQQYSYQLLQKQAQLNAMQSQINPHFLYNALDSIRGLALEQGAAETADMTEALATLFRFSISKKNDFISLYEELKNMDNYIKIQKYRFHNRFELVKDIRLSDEQLHSYKIPKLTLQPIVENALNHGLKDKASDGKILLHIEPTKSRLIICISDNGSGMDDNQLRSINQRFTEPVVDTISSESKQSNSGSGIALNNVNARLKLIFGDRFGLNAYSTKNFGTEIQISLPLLEGGKPC